MPTDNIHLVFPDAVYERIEDYHYQKVRPQAAGKVT